MGERFNLAAELSALPSHEAKAAVTAALAQRIARSMCERLAERERELHQAIDRYHAAQDEADRWLSLAVSAASCVVPARERDDAERAEAARRRVA